jgi:hypothetical protein
MQSNPAIFEITIDHMLLGQSEAKYSISELR